MNKTDPRDELVGHLPAMRTFAISPTRDAVVADDTVQDAIEKAWVNFDKFNAGTNLRACLFTILRVAFYSAERKTNREVADVDGVLTEALAEKLLHDGRLQMTDFRSAFAQLSDEQREALLLVGLSGFSYEVASEMCDAAIGTVKSRTGRARQRLAELTQLEEEDSLEMTDDETLSVLTAATAASF